MYYHEEEIFSHLICPRCKTKFIDPRIIVPCFETLCDKCIGDLTDDKKNEIDCYFCHRKHPTPNGGFASNKILIHMLNLKANEFNTSESVKKFGEIIDVIKSRNEELESNVAKSRLIINEHCSEVKAQIDLLVETRKKQLDDMRDDLLQIIDAYEKECVDNLGQIDTKVFLDGINETNKFLSDSREFLKRIRADQDEDAIRDMTRDADDHLANVESLHLQLKGAQFNGHLVNFKPSEFKNDHAAIGSVVFEDLEIPSNIKTTVTSLESGKNLI
jgi:hypothetical protein